MSDEVSIVCFSREDAHAAALKAYALAQTLLANGSNALIECKAANEPISTRQRKFLKDIVFGQISDQVLVEQPGGKRIRYVKAAWAELYRSQLLGDRWELVKLPGQRTKRRKVRNSTEELGVRAYAEYTNRVIDDAVAEHGVEFHFTSADEEVRAYKPKERKRHAEKAEDSPAT